MGPATLSDQALKAGVDIPISKAEYFLQERRRVFPEIYEWHKRIREQLCKDRTLWTPFGRRRFFLGKLDNKLFRESYAHIPQSTVPHITNLMWLWVHNNWYPDDARILQMGHDSLVIQVRKDIAKQFSKEFFDATKRISKFEINAIEYIIPWDGDIADCWGDI
jgi:DNA polymerase I-like protein with 3'-5' exonuclease and polymerase domains